MVLWAMTALMACRLAQPSHLPNTHLEGRFTQGSNCRFPDQSRFARRLATAQCVAIQPEWRHAGSVAGFGAWVPVRHASACGWPDLPGSGAWCVRVVAYGAAVAGGSQSWPLNSRVRASSASMPHLPAVDR